MSEVTGVDAVLHGLDAWAAGTRKAALAAAHEIAQVLEEYAKQNHPWTDDTGDTRATTKGTVADETSGVITIWLSAGMDYDVLLELARNGKWAWLHPAILANQEKIRRILKKHLSEVHVKR